MAKNKRIQQIFAHLRRWQNDGDWRFDIAEC